MGVLNTTNDKVEQSARWQRRKEERPAEILCSALKIFTEKGFAATRLDEVAKNAGISKGTLYLYFESKEALFQAMVIEFVVPHIDRAEEHADNYAGNIRDLFSEITSRWYFEIMNSDISSLPKLIISEAGNFPEIAEFYLEKVIQRGRRFIAKLIQTGIEQGEFRQVDPEMTARNFLAPLVFAAIWERSLAPHDKEYDLKTYFDNHLQIFLQGIALENSK